MGSRCYWCGDKFGRCYERGGACPEDCNTHDCATRDHWLDIEDSELDEDAPCG